MKIRQGFVSNSSSSSFVIMGIDLTDHLTEEKDVEYFEELIWKTNDSILCVEYDGWDGYYVGAAYYRIKDDETLKEFKNKITNDIKNILGIDVSESDLKWKSACYMDG